MLIDQTTLLAATGLKRPADLERHLRRARIPFRRVAGRILTTSEAITQVLVGKKNETGPDFAALTQERPHQARPVLLRLAAGRASGMAETDEGR